jgi:hypothetical protein
MDKRRVSLFAGVDKWKRTPSKSTKATSMEPGLPEATDDQSRTGQPEQGDSLGKLLSKRVLDDNVSWLRFSNEAKPLGRFQQRTSRRIMVNLELRRRLNLTLAKFETQSIYLQPYILI